MLKQSVKQKQKCSKNPSNISFAQGELPVIRETRKAGIKHQLLTPKRNYTERGQSGLVCQEAREGLTASAILTRILRKFGRLFRKWPALCELLLNSATSVPSLNGHRDSAVSAVAHLQSSRATCGETWLQLDRKGTHHLQKAEGTNGNFLHSSFSLGFAVSSLKEKFYDKVRRLEGKTMAQLASISGLRNLIIKHKIWGL